MRSTRIPPGRHLLRTVLVVAALLGSTAFQCPDMSQGVIRFLAPLPLQLSETGDVQVKIGLRGFAHSADLVLTLDGNDVSAALTRLHQGAEASLAVPNPGWHQLVARLPNPGGHVLQQSVAFETVTLDHADVCETLNAIECLLPYPSNLFRKVEGGSAHLVFPQVGMPTQSGHSVPTAMFEVRDGFNPTVQILANFPQHVDLVASGAPRLHAEPIRSTDLTSLSPDSPTVLLHEGRFFWQDERVLHWVENDARIDDPDVLASGVDPARRILFMRPGRSLEPGESYIVAFRNLVDVDGQPVQAEPVFAALRDRRPTTIPSVEARRADFEKLFVRLAHDGVRRKDLVLAWDFTVASDENLTGQMVSMRDQGLDWLAAQHETSAPTFTVDKVQEFDCSVDGQRIWKNVTGTYQVPLFLDKDPVTSSLAAGYLMVGNDGFTPKWSTTTNPQYGIAIPCAAKDQPLPAVVVGHGLFGDGPSFAQQVNDLLNEADKSFGVGAMPAITGGTHWRGLSSVDFPGYIGITIALNLKNFPSLPDRLRQGMLNQIILAEMMRQGAFNADPTFQASDHGVFAESDHYDYFGISLGGIMGTFFAALAPHLENANVDVPGINFSMLLQRATPFLLFQALLDASVGKDPMTQALGLSLLEELWATGEPAGYATHVTSHRLPGSGPPPHVLMTMAFLDQQVSNQDTEIAARTLGLPTMEGSYLSGFPLIPHLPGPLPSAFVVYNTGSLVPGDPHSEPFIPPLANLTAEPSSKCDPHPRRVLIPASLRQLSHFLASGEIANFCDGLCDADPAATDTGPGGNVFQLELPSDGNPCPPS